jgi:hypothetical protein
LDTGQPAKQPAGPFDFTESSTSGAAAPALEFGDAGRGAKKGRGSSSNIKSSASATSSVSTTDQPGYPPGVQPSASTSRLKPSGRMQRLTKIGVLSLAKVMGASGVLMGLVIGSPYGLLMILLSLAGFASEGGGAMGAVGLGFALAMMVGIPIIYGVGGFVGGLIYGLIMNLVLGFTGGLEIELQ